MLLLSFLFYFDILNFARGGEFDILDFYKDDPNPGPELDSAYVPGTAGGDWTDDDVESTRIRLLEAVHPDWRVSQTLYGYGARTLRITENKILRLAFHDCAKYTDGTGGCDGCLDWRGVGARLPHIFDEEDWYTFEPVNTTDNNGLEETVAALELIYTTIDWPFKEPRMTASLKQLGKSRADFWQFAGLVMLERALERANRACDLDKWGRQQVTLLEGRDACEFKLHAPLKFWTGRSDCVSLDADGHGYKTGKHEVSPRMLGDAKHTTDFFENYFGMDAEHSQALLAVHGAVHQSNVGVKYTWMGTGYISNMYFKMIANHPIYQFDQGGDFVFGSTRSLKMKNLYAKGDANGNPQPYTGWRASCMYLWNTTEGGPCFMRPTHSNAFDAPSKDFHTVECVDSVDGNSKPVMRNTKQCADAWADENNIIHGAPYGNVLPECEGPFSDVDLDDEEERQNRHSNGWNNMFAFPWEISAAWDFTTRTEKGQHATGCPGLDSWEKWPYRNMNSPIYGSYAMNCSRQSYKNLADIVDKFASDQQYWSVRFLEAWDTMATNGYDQLNEGPYSGWFASWSLKKQGRTDLEQLEEEMVNGGIVWTDPNADPYICGHVGHATTSCAFTYSNYIERILTGGEITGDGMDTILGPM